MKDTATAVFCRRVRWGLESICLRWWCLARSAGRMRCMTERLNMVRVKDEIVEVRNLN